jgi:hypothetical protein
MTPGQMMEFGLWVAATKAAEAELKAEYRALPIAEMEVPVRSWRFGSRWEVVVRVRRVKRVPMVKRCMVWLLSLFSWFFDDVCEYEEEMRGAEVGFYL